MKFLKVFLPVLLIGLFSLKFCKAQTSNSTTNSTATTVAPAGTAGTGSAKKVFANLRYTSVRRLRLNNANGAGISGTGSSINSRNRNRRGNRNTNGRRNRNANRGRRSNRGARNANGRRRGGNRRRNPVIRLN